MCVSDANMECGVESGVVLAVPIPIEASCTGNKIEAAIQQALKEARLVLTTSEGGPCTGKGWKGVHHVLHCC